MGDPARDMVKIWGQLSSNKHNLCIHIVDAGFIIRESQNVCTSILPIRRFVTACATCHHLINGSDCGPWVELKDGSGRVTKET
jgi:hypothetical protein